MTPFSETTQAASVPRVQTEDARLLSGKTHYSSICIHVIVSLFLVDFFLRKLSPASNTTYLNALSYRAQPVHLQSRGMSSTSYTSAVYYFCSHLFFHLNKTYFMPNSQAILALLLRLISPSSPNKSPTNVSTAMLLLGESWLHQVWLHLLVSKLFKSPFPGGYFQAAPA